MRPAAILLALACFAACPARAAEPGSASPQPSQPVQPAQPPQPPPGPKPAPAPREPLRFAGLAWDSGVTEVARVLVARGFSHVSASNDAPVAWQGQAFGSRAQLTTDVAVDGRLIAVTLRFFPETPVGEVQRFNTLAEAVRRKHGPWTVHIEPGRPVDAVRLGRFAETRYFGPVTAAALWTDGQGAAAAVQLDGTGVLWLRYESPRWEAATQEKADAAIR